MTWSSAQITLINRSYVPRNLVILTVYLKTSLREKWSAISEDSCGKTKYARPHRFHLSEADESRKLAFRPRKAKEITDHFHFGHLFMKLSKLLFFYLHSLFL